MAKMKALIAGSVMAAGALTGVAQAEWTGNLGVTSAYIFRGDVLATPAVQGGIDWESDTTGLYVGTWLSNAGSAATNTSTEVDFYAGYEFGLGSLSLDLGGIWYGFPGEDESVGASNPSNSWEVYGGLSGSKWNIYAWYNFGLDEADDDEFAYIEGNLALGAWDLHLGYKAGLGDAYDGNCNEGDSGYAVNACQDGAIDMSIAYNIGAFSLGTSIKTTDNDRRDTESPEFYVKYKKEFAVR